jgi:hypothetical protein
MDGNDSQRPARGGGLPLLALAMAVVLGAIGGALLSRPAPTVSVVGNDQISERLLSVNGSGTVHVVPDQALFNAGVTFSAPSVREARASANQAMTGVLAALHDLGIADTDIRTTNLSLYPQYPPSCPYPYLTPGDTKGSSGTGLASPEPANSPAPDASPILPPMPEPSPLPTYLPCGIDPSVPIGYTFSQTIEVTVRDLDLLGDALDAATRAGATSVDSLRFSLADPDKASANARSAAVADARARATALAAAAGTSLARVHTINETSYAPPLPYYALEKDSAGSSIAVSPGSLEVTVNVSVIWELGN